MKVIGKGSFGKVRRVSSPAYLTIHPEVIILLFIRSTGHPGAQKDGQEVVRDESAKQGRHSETQASGAHSNGASRVGNDQPPLHCAPALRFPDRREALLCAGLCCRRRALFPSFSPEEISGSHNSLLLRRTGPGAGRTSQACKIRWHELKHRYYSYNIFYFYIGGYIPRLEAREHFA